MKKLQKEFKGRASQKGFDFIQMEREDYKALYMKCDEYCNFYYEAIIVRVQPETKIGGNIIPESEKYPSDNEFGTYGICTSDYNKAKLHYDNITYTPNE